MAETYCGKTCEGCVHREALGCPGCKDGPGRAWSHECDLAKCCRDKGHEACDTCGFKAGCGKLWERERIPAQRLKKRSAEAERKAKIARKAPFLGKWLWLMFWLVVPGELAGLMSNETIVKRLPALDLPGQVLSLLCTAAYGLILLKISSEDVHYRTSGFCCLAAAAVGGVVLCVPVGGEAASWIQILKLPAGIVALVGEYHEYMGHAAVLNGVDMALSEGWEKLWKWYIGLFAAALGSIFVVLINSFLGMLTTLAAAVGLLVVSVLKLVYLYRTAKLFREYPV